MPSVGLKYVVSFSSQDSKHPVTNLTAGDGCKKWLSHPQEKSLSIEATFQLDCLCHISYLDIGSIWCATIEIQVGRSDWPAGKEFETLVYTVSLMTPSDCSLGKNTVKTQMFSSDLFCPVVAKQQWDRLKIICKQPYKKHVQFGLSFIRVTTTGSTPTDKKETSNVQQTASVKSIQKHFFGKVPNGLSTPKENLKSKLLKIAGTAENGAEHDSSLSRTAKLVLAASGSKPKVFSSEMKSPVTESRGMYSSHTEKKYTPKFEDEAKQFFSELKINENELDKIMIADLRHKFERLKKRKLTKEEKKQFRDMAEEFISEKFGAKTVEYEENKPVSSGVNKIPVATKEMNKPMALTPSRSSITNTKKNSKSVENDKHERIISGKGQKVEATVNSRPSVKRKLEESDVMTPVTKARKADTLLQKLKSPEHSKPFTERTNLEPLKNKVSTPLNIKPEMNTPRGVFQYKGIRSGEDPDISMFMKSGIDKNNIADEITNVLHVKSPTCVYSPRNEVNCSILSSDDSLPDISVGTEMEFYIEGLENKQEHRSNGKTKRGRGGRGQRSRGSRNQSRALTYTVDNVVEVMDDELEMDMEVSNSSGRARGRGRGVRGKGSGHGRGRKKKETSTAPVFEETSCVSLDSPPRIPRGFVKCTGCNDVFGEMLITAHQLRCSAYKAKQTSATTAVSSSPALKSIDDGNKISPLATRTSPPVTSTPSTPRGRSRGRGRGRGSRRTPGAAANIRCEGCNNLFSDMMIEKHREMCTPYQLRLIDEEQSLDTPPTSWMTDTAMGTTSTERGRGRGGKAGKSRGKKVSSTASLEVRPTGFAKCDGCNQYFRENLLTAHQERCPSLKNKSQQSASGSPWLSARPTDPASPVTTPRANRSSVGSPRNKPGSVSASENRNDSSERQGSQLRSPPWLLAAEKRLEKQRLQQQSTTTIKNTKPSVSTSHALNDNVSSVINAVSDRNSNRQAIIDAQAKQLEKYRSVSETTPSECYRSNHGFSNSPRGSFAGRSVTRDRGAVNRSVDLTTESDDEDDSYNEAEDCNDDLDGFIVNDGDDIDDHGDYNPDNSSQVVEDSGDNSSSDNEPEDLMSRNILVECPLCGEYFPDMIIQVHAATCYL